MLCWARRGGRPPGTPLRGDGAVRQESGSSQRFLISLLFPNMRGTSGARLGGPIPLCGMAQGVRACEIGEPRNILLTIIQ